MQQTSLGSAVARQHPRTHLSVSRHTDFKRSLPMTFVCLCFFETSRPLACRSPRRMLQAPPTNAGLQTSAQPLYKTAYQCKNLKCWSAPRENNRNKGTRPCVEIMEHPGRKRRNHSVHRTAYHRIKQKYCTKSRLDPGAPSGGVREHFRRSPKTRRWSKALVHSRKSPLQLVYKITLKTPAQQHVNVHPKRARCPHDPTTAEKGETESNIPRKRRPPRSTSHASRRKPLDENCEVRELPSFTVRRLTTGLTSTHAANFVEVCPTKEHGAQRTERHTVHHPTPSRRVMDEKTRFKFLLLLFSHVRDCWIQHIPWRPKRFLKLHHPFDLQVSTTDMSCANVLRLPCTGINPCSPPSPGINPCSPPSPSETSLEPRNIEPQQLVTDEFLRCAPRLQTLTHLRLMSAAASARVLIVDTKQAYNLMMTVSLLSTTPLVPAWVLPGLFLDKSSE